MKQNTKNIISFLGFVTAVLGIGVVAIGSIAMMLIIGWHILPNYFDFFAQLMIVGVVVTFIGLPLLLLNE